MTIAAADLLATFLLYLFGYTAVGILIGYLIYRFVKKHNIHAAQFIKIGLLVVGIVIVIATLALNVV